MKKIFLITMIASIALTYCGQKPRLVLPAEDQFLKAKGLYDRGKYYKAQLEFENLIYTYPGNTVIDTAQFYLGMCYYNQKDYGLGAGELKRLLTSYPTSALADDAQYYIAMSHYNMSPRASLDQSETILAIGEFNELITNYPTSSYIEGARGMVRELENKLAEKSFRTGELYLKMNDYQAALTYFAFVRDNYPSTDWAIRAFYFSGEAQMQLERFDDARVTFEKFLLGYSNHELALKAKEKLEKLNSKITTEEG